MRTYFGIPFDAEGEQYMDLFARLFMCPRTFSCKKVKMCVENLIAGKLNMNQLLSVTDNAIQEYKEIKNFKDMFSRRRQEWENCFGLLTETDLAYLTERYGLTFTPQIITTKDMVERASQIVGGREREIKDIAPRLYLHGLRSKLNRTYSPPAPMLIIGSTGTGKTFTVETLAKLCDVPYVKFCTSSFTPPSWKGPSFSTEVLEQYRIHGDKLKTAIFHITEIDKICFNMSSQKKSENSEYAADMTRQIMALLDRDPLQLEDGMTGNLQARTIPFPLDRVFFVFDGAFYGLSSIVRRRIQGERKIGFSSSAREGVSETNWLKYVTSGDLVEYGFPPELAGRLGGNWNIVVMDDLTPETMFQGLVKSKNGVLSSNMAFCKEYKRNLRFEESALKLICEEACQRKPNLGFREANQMIERVLETKYFDVFNEASNEWEDITIDESFVAKQLNLKTC